MLLDAGSPSIFWSEAMAIAAYVHNRSPKRNLHMKTSEESSIGTIADLSHLRIFGCEAHSLIPATKFMAAKSIKWLGTLAIEKYKDYGILRPKML